MLNSVINKNIERLLRPGVLLLLSLFTANAHAVIVVDNVSTVVDNNPTTLTQAHATNAGSDRLMLVGVSLLNEDLETVTSVTYNGTGLTFVGQVSQGNDSRVEIWALVNPPVTTANVVVTFNEQVQRGAVVGIITFTGVDQTTPYGVFQSNSGDSNTASATVTSSVGDLVFGMMAAEQQDSGPVVVGGTEQWSRKSRPGNNRTAGAAATFVGAATVNLTWNMNETDDWAIGAISLRDASAVTSSGFCDDFESGIGNWVVNASGGGSAGINGDTFNSASNSLFLRWDPVDVTSASSIDATGTPYQLSLWLRRGDDTFSENPEAGEDFQVQYFNNIGTWITLETFAGGGPPGEIFERNYSLPANAQHASLRVRFVQTAGSGNDWDYWHVDDVCVLEVVQADIEYRMDELQWDGSANEVVDSSGNGNDANANAASGLTTVNPGQICRAGDFDGIDDYIESTSIDTYLRNTSSMSFWIRTTQTGNDTGWQAPGIAGVEENGGSDDIFWGWLDASGRIGVSVGNDYATKSSVAINDDVYHHVVLTRDAASGDYKIYIDGALDSSGTSTAGVIGNGFSSIGRIENTGATAPLYLQGDLDELLVFNSVLSDSAVASIYLNQSNGRNLDGNPRNCAGAFAWFQLDADAGVWNGNAGEVVDQSGNFNAAFALGTGAGVNSVPAQVCRGIDIPLNTSNGAQYGFDSRVDVDDDVGNDGTISFWYKSDNIWAGGGDRALFDASPDSLSNPDKFFLLMLRNDGALQFAVEDTADNDYIFNSGVQGFGANAWVHVAVTWSMSGNRQIYINGTLAATDTGATTGSLGELDTIYFGDNRSSYHFGGTANSANGVIDEVRVYDRVQTQAEIAIDLNATHACGSGTLNRFVITPATVNASTCLPNEITIEAQDSAFNTLTTYTGTVDISTSTGHGNWSVSSATNPTNPDPDNNDDGAVSYSFVAADAGVIALNLINTHAETLQVTVNDPLQAVVTTSVDITYISDVFVITEDTLQVAGRPMAMNVAMWTDDLAGSGTCGIDTNYNDNAQNIVASIDRAGVLNAAINPTIAGVPIPDTLDFPASVTITLDFSVTPGQVNFNLDTTDVGQYRLTLEDTTNNYSSSTITGSSAQLTVRPFGIGVSNIMAGATLNMGFILPGDLEFTIAGADFEATVAGVLWLAGDDTDDDGVLDNGAFYYDNPVAPSYASTTVLSVSAAPTTFWPEPGTPGVLNNATILQGEFGSGFFNVTDLQYTEVGSFTLQSSADDFLGDPRPSYDLVGDDIVIGRFRPDEFSVQITENGVFDNACGTFTYIGQAFSYATAPTIKLRALNALGNPTAQYRGGFNKLSAGSVSVDASEDEIMNGTDLLPLQVGYTAAAMSITKNPDGSTDYTFGADVYRYGPEAPVSFSKFAESQVILFDADIDPEISAVTDGEITSNFPADTYLLNPDPLSNHQRFGRLRMSNVHGTELSSLLMPAFTEFWNGVGWSKSLDDSCTSIADANLVSVASPLGLSIPTVFNTPFAAAGNVDYSYPAPGAGNVGFIDTTTDLNAAGHLWLRYDWAVDGEFDNDPGARATFGIFDGDPVQIYIRQIYQ